MQECGDDKLWRCQGRDPCCYSQTPKNTPPNSSLVASSSLFFHPTPPLFLFLFNFWNFFFALSLSLPLSMLKSDSTFTSTSSADTDAPSLCLIQPFPEDHFPFISLCFFFAVHIPWLSVRSQVCQMHHIFPAKLDIILNEWDKG